MMCYTLIKRKVLIFKEVKNMKLRRFTMALCILALLVPVFAGIALAADGDVVWDMSKDEKTAYVAGNKGNDDANGNYKNSGGGERSLDGNSIKFSKRDQPYAAFDIVTEKLIPDASKEYTIVVKVHSDKAVDFRLGQAKGPYGTYVLAEGSTKATLTLNTKDAALLSPFDPTKNIRVQTNEANDLGAGAYPDFYIDSITIYEGKPPVAAPAAAGAANPKTGDNFVIFLAIGVLAIAGCGAVVFYRKSKEN